MSDVLVTDPADFVARAFGLDTDGRVLLIEWQEVMFRYFRGTAHQGPPTRRGLANELYGRFGNLHDPIRSMLREQVKAIVDEEKRVVLREDQAGS